MTRLPVTRWVPGALAAVLLGTAALSACTVRDGSPGGRQVSEMEGSTVGDPVPASLPAGHHVLGLKWNWSQPATLDYAAGTGSGLTFAEVEWCSVEPVQGARDWSRTDQIVRDSQQLGHEVMLKLRTGQCWATQPPDPGVPDRTEVVRKTPSTPPVDEAVYRGFVTELVSRYAAMGVHTYAVENEPDVYNFWAGTIAEYEDLVRLVVPVIREADPGARVLDAGLSSTGYGVVLAQRLTEQGDPEAALAAYQGYYARRIEGGASRWPQVDDTTELSRVLATAPATRAVEVLRASARLVDEGVVDAYQLHFYEPTSELQAVLDLVRDSVGTADVEAWEVGVAWPGDGYDAVVSAAETVRLVATLLAEGVTRVVYLPLAYTPGTTPQVFRGLIDESGQVFPAGESFRLLAGLLRAGGDRELHRVDPGTGLTGVVVDRGDQGQVAVLWTTGGEVSLAVDDDETVVDHLGNPLSSDVTVRQDPVVITSPGPSLERLAAAG